MNAPSAIISSCRGGRERGSGEETRGVWCAREVRRKVRAEQKPAAREARAVREFRRCGRSGCSRDSGVEEAQQEEGSRKIKETGRTGGREEGGRGVSGVYLEQDRPKLSKVVFFEPFLRQLLLLLLLPVRPMRA